MRWFRRRAWYLASIAIGLAAVLVEVQAKSIVAGGVGRIAAAAQARAEGAANEVIVAMKAQGSAQVDRGANLSVVGLIVAVASGLSFFMSRVKSEFGPRIVPIAVWIVYISFSFMMV
jgi:hypothetical protein